MINGGVHKTILSDGILPQQNKKEKILLLTDQAPFFKFFYLKILSSVNGDKNAFC